MSYNILENEVYKSDIIDAVMADLPWDKLHSKTILLTGASGMIASVIIDIIMYRNIHYNQNTHIIAVSRSEAKAGARFLLYWDNKYFSWLSHDITQPLPELGNIDYILHAASNTHPRAYATDPIGTITANVQGTYELLKYASEHSCECFMLFSSVEIYGENRGDVDRFDESYLGYIDSNTVRAGYPESKRLAESLCNAFATQKSQDFVIGRFSRVYGPTMAEDDSKAIAQFIQKSVAGEDIILKSKGNQLYSYTYVVDAAVAALYILLKAPSGSAINVADSKSELTLKDLASILSNLAGSRVVFELPDIVERTGYSTATKATLNAAQIEVLGWKPHTHIEYGLQKTVNVLKVKAALEDNC